MIQYLKGVVIMENCVAVIAIIVSDTSAVDRVNGLLTAFRDNIVGRMGIPHKNGHNIISIAMEAPKEVINSLSGKLGMISGVTSKVVVAK